QLMGTPCIRDIVDKIDLVLRSLSSEVIDDRRRSSGPTREIEKEVALGRRRIKLARNQNVSRNRCGTAKVVLEDPDDTLALGIVRPEIIVHVWRDQCGDSHRVAGSVHVKDIYVGERRGNPLLDRRRGRTVPSED